MDLIPGMMYRVGPNWHWIMEQKGWKPDDLILAMGYDTIVVPPAGKRPAKEIRACGFYAAEKYELISFHNFKILIRDKILRMVRNDQH